MKLAGQICLAIGGLILIAANPMIGAGVAFSLLGFTLIITSGNPKSP